MLVERATGSGASGSSGPGPRSPACDQVGGGRPRGEDERQERGLRRAERRRRQQSGAAGRGDPGPAAAQVGQRDGDRGERRRLAEHDRVRLERPPERPGDRRRTVAARDPEAERRCGADERQVLVAKPGDEDGEERPRSGLNRAAGRPAGELRCERQ